MEDWNGLRVFLAVAREGTLAAAAEALGSSISSVHREVRGLEAQLQTRLFERRGRGSVLTSAGEDLLVRAERIEDEMHSIARDVAGRDAGLRGRVVVTTTDTLAHGILAELLPVLHARYPGIEVTLSVDNRHYRLGRGEADVALRPGERPREPDVVPRHVTDVHYAYYASRDYLAQRGRPRSKKALCHHTAIVPDESLGRTVYGAAAEVFDVDRVAVRSASLHMIAAATARGLGVAALPCFLGDEDPRLVRLFKPELEGPLWLLYHQELRGSARVRAVVDLLDHEITRLRPRLQP